MIEQEGTKKLRKKRKFKRKFLLFVIIVLFIWWFNNFTIKIAEDSIKSDKINSAMTFAVISDYHAEKWAIQPDKIIKKLDKIEPDIVFYLGDMYSRTAGQTQRDLATKLMIDTAKAGYSVYFVPGEHDQKLDYLNKLLQNNINVMNYRTDIINVNGNDVRIYGIDNAHFSDSFDLSNEFILDDRYYNILLAHIPQYEYYNKFGADLTLCGDTHGGIIQLPFNRGPAYYTADEIWFPEILERREDVYDKGLFSMDNNNYMYITSGIGHFPVPARLNNRPEIAVITVNPD